MITRADWLPDGLSEQQRGWRRGSKATLADTASQWLPARTSSPMQMQTTTAVDGHQSAVQSTWCQPAYHSPCPAVNTTQHTSAGKDHHTNTSHIPS